MKEFLNWWQHIPEHINPNILSIGSFQLRYYGLMYLLGFTTVYLLIMYRLKNERIEISISIIKSYFFWMIFATLIGGRLGYVLFYNLKYYLKNPLEIILPFELNQGFRYTGIYGMSYHGALIAAILASIIFCHKYKINFWRLSDLFSPAIPLGYTFGRLGNFINGELYGRITNFSLGMYFPLDPLHQLRHPSQLYEAFFEGIFLFLILWSIRKIKVFDGFQFCLYLMGYGLVRFFIEFFREPDPQIGFILGGFTRGQLFCLAMIVGGTIIMIVKKFSSAKIFT